LLLNSVGVAVRDVVHVAQQRHRGFAELGLAHQTQAASGFTVEAAHRRDEARFACRRFGEFHRAFYRFGAAGDEEGVLQVARRNRRQQVCQHAAWPVKKLLGGHGRPVELGLHGGDHLLVRPSEAQQPISAEGIQVGAPHRVHECRAASAPLDRGEVAALGDGFTIVQKAGIVVFGKVAQGHANQFFSLRAFETLAMDDVQILT
jgi:hypothetical protein